MFALLHTPENVFKKNAAGTSGANLYSFKSCTPFRIITMLWMPCMEWIVACYNQRIVEERTGVAPITVGLLGVWYGIRMYMALYKRPTERHYFIDIVCGGLFTAMPNLSKNMTYTTYMEMKSNMRYEHYDTKTDEDMKYKAWKVKTIFEMVK